MNDHALRRTTMAGIVVDAVLASTCAVVIDDAFWRGWVVGFFVVLALGSMNIAWYLSVKLSYWESPNPVDRHNRIQLEATLDELGLPPNGDLTTIIRYYTDQQAKR